MSGSAGVARLSLYPTCVADIKTIRCHLKDNEAHIYTPDFEVIFVNGLSCYYEIKYQADINRVPNFDLWFSDVKKSAKKNNKELRLVTREFNSEVQHSPNF